MKILTKEIQGNLQGWGVGSSINVCIRMTRKTKETRKRPPRKNTIARQLWDSNGACIISGKEWNKEYGYNLSKDDTLYICGLEWNRYAKKWDLFPMRYIGKKRYNLYK